MKKPWKVTTDEIDGNRMLTRGHDSIGVPWDVANELVLELRWAPVLHQMLHAKIKKALCPVCLEAKAP